MWGELGIEPTADATVIRRAYAQRLRAIDPDRDPAAFQRLREAYEAALSSSARDTGRKTRRGKASRAPVADPVPLESAPSASAASPPSAAETASASPPRPKDQLEPPQDVAETLQHYRAEARPVLDALDRALDDRDAQRALALFDEAIAKGLLPLTPDQRFVERLTEVVAGDPGVPAETFQRLLRTFGWDTYPGGAHASQPRSLAPSIGRLKAAAWYAQLRADANERRFGPREADRNFARVMLGHNRLLPMFAGPAVRNRLRAELAQYDHHRPWLDGRFDPARIEWLREKTREKVGGKRSRIFTGLFFIVVVTNLLRACFDPSISHQTAPPDTKPAITGH